MVVLLTTLLPILGHIRLPEMTRSFWPGASVYTSQTGRNQLPLRPQVPLYLDQQLVNFSWEESESCCCQSSGPCNTCSISQPESSYSWCFQKVVSYFSRTLITETKVRLRGMCWFSLPTLFLKSPHLSRVFAYWFTWSECSPLGKQCWSFLPKSVNSENRDCFLPPYLHYLCKDREGSLKFLEWMDEFH